MGATTISLQAQSVREDLERFYQNFDGVEDLYFELENRLTKGDEVGLAQKGKVYKQGDKYYYKIDNYQMLVNKRYILIIDDQKKLMICKDWDQEKADQLRQQKIPSIEAILKKYPNITYEGTNKGLKHYTLQNDQEMLYKVEVFLDASSGFAQKTIYHYHPKSTVAGAVLQLSIPTINTKPSFPKGLFSEQQFLQEKQGQLVPTAQYAAYTLHDLRLPASK